MTSANTTQGNARRDGFITDEKAFAWAKRMNGATELELVKAHPWSRIFRTHGSHGRGYLKVLPEHERNALLKTRLISQSFPEIVPEITATDEKLGLLLMREIDGIPLGDAAPEPQVRKLLSTYAGIQAEAAKNQALLQGLPWIRLRDVMQSFFDFLDPEISNDGVGADFFLQKEEASGYVKALTVRRGLLQRLLDKVAPLPPTLNHCDLHTGNTAEKHDGTMVIFDWDDARVGPAGMSLHRLLDGCTPIYRLLNGDAEMAGQAPHLQRLFSAWANRLALGGYADAPLLVETLPAAACIGSLLSMQDYSRFGNPDEDYRESIADILRERLEDLLQLTDELALNSRDDTLFFANDYLQNGVPWRAVYLLDRYLANHPNDIAIHQWSGDLHMASQQWSAALNNYASVVRALPEEAASHFQMGVALLKSGQLDLAIEAFDAALAIDPAHEEAAANRRRTRDLISRRQQAALPHQGPSLRLSDEEKNGNYVDSEHVDYAEAMFREHGYIVIENLFPKALVESVSDAFFNRYDAYFEDRLYPDNLILGDKRRMVSVALEGILNSPRLYGNALVVELMRRMLGEDYVMGGYNAVVSLPGAKDKGLHKDYPPLFKNEPAAHHVTPTFAVSVLFPLIELTEAHGVTSMRKGTHRLPEETPWEAPEQKPVLKLGDAIIFDYRTAHDGLANRTDSVRPLMSMIFHRVWFRDALNYVHQKAVEITPEELERVPAEYKHLFRWALSDNAERKTDAVEAWNKGIEPGQVF